MRCSDAVSSELTWGETVWDAALLESYLVRPRHVAAGAAADGTVSPEIGLAGGQVTGSPNLSAPPPCVPARADGAASPPGWTHRAVSP